MPDKRNNNFPHTPEHFITDKSNANALKMWNHLADVYDGQNIDVSTSAQLLQAYCENSQMIELLTDQISKNMGERIDILHDMSDLQILAGFISIQKGFARKLSLIKAIKNYEKRN